MDWEPSYKERFPAWRSSDGVLKEKGAEPVEKESRGRLEHQASIPGYRSSEEEKKRHDEPRKIWELSSSYGTLAIGKNKKKQLMIVNSQRRTKELQALTPESKELRRETSVKIPLISGDFRFNEDWNRREKSAYSYQLEASHSPDYLMRKMKELHDQRTLKVQENINPFFDLSEDKEELAHLRETAAEMARNHEQDAEKGLRVRTQFVTAALADKERQRRKFYTKLPDLLEEARKEETADWRFAKPYAEVWEADTDDDKDDTDDDADDDDIDEDDGESELMP
ncbi:MAG: hypothetical protein LBH09_06595 [Peptococcaceae bacterium]|jgi:hypothetical protein|nr:hypothetical protein [Peptococcaceae bacterium]